MPLRSVKLLPRRGKRPRSTVFRPAAAGKYDAEFIDQLYRIFHRRDADQRGFQFYVQEMADGTPPHEIVRRFLYSEEFAANVIDVGALRAKRADGGAAADAGSSAGPADDTAYGAGFIAQLYRLFLDRPADEDGLKYHMQLLADGVPPHGIVERFLHCDEFCRRLPPGALQGGPLDDEWTDRRLKWELQDPPWFSATIDAGRNLRAGYLRGCGISDGIIGERARQDEDWLSAVRSARGRAIVTDERLLNLFLIIKYANLHGNIIEFGSYRGGSALLMARLAKRLRPNCKVFALDTFAGMPATDRRLDWHRCGDFVDADFEELLRIRDDEGLDNLVLVKGLFEDGVGEIPTDERQFFLSHIDCDIYHSVKFSIDFAKRHAVPGAYIVFDDPVQPTCLGAMQAVEEDLVQKEGIFAEQVYPHLVYRYPPLGRANPSRAFANKRFGFDWRRLR